MHAVGFYRKVEQEDRESSTASPQGTMEAGSPRKTMRGDDRGTLSRNTTGRALRTEQRNLLAAVRSGFQATEWYQSVMAMRIRTLLQGKKAAVITTLALLTALFLPDVLVLLGANSNVESDIVLMVVLVLFTIESGALALVDANYVFSFFHFMDILGTASIIFDISFLLGDDVQEPHTVKESAAEWQLLLMKGLSFARVGARAGRLSRVLRMLRHLPCMEGQDGEKTSGIAMVITAQLANMMATRVACLTIILVMVIPLFNIMNFPQNDYSLQTWVERISVFMKEGNMQRVLAELENMSKFFDRHRYGPYMACRGRADGLDFLCEQEFSEWTPRISAPPRQASAILVHSDDLMVGFNMHHPITTHAGLNIVNFVFVILIMLFSGLLLTTTVTELAVRPLQRMLNTVRQIASTVFNFEDGGQAAEEEDVDDINSANEMILLEKVVGKLATVASLHAKEDTLQTTEGMQDEDIAVLTMMQGKKINVGQALSPEPTQDNPRLTVRKSADAPDLPGRLTVMPTAGGPLDDSSLSLEKTGITQDMYDSWAFNSLTLTAAQSNALCVHIVATFHMLEENNFISEKQDYQTLQTFVTAAQMEYPPNIFHNFAHATDTVHGVSKILTMMCADLFLSPLEEYTLLISAIGHDLGHPGVNNGFLLETGDPLALQYNDRSPLENMHCAKLYSIVAVPEANVFGSLSKEQYCKARKQCIETILHTDMIGHQAMVKELQMTYQMNSEVFVLSSATKAISSRRSSIKRKSGSNQIGTELDVFRQPEINMLILETILHSADVSNPCRSWEVSKQWAWRVLDEFFAQGDKERELGIPLQFLNDRDKLNKYNSQIGFIEFMIAPFFAAQIRLWPGLKEYGKNLSNNIRNWEDLWVQESQPPADEKEKVSARVLKVSDTLEAATM